MSEKSEFGRGVVVCIAKFSEHLLNDMAMGVLHQIQWNVMSEEKRRELKDEAMKYPIGDSARIVTSVDRGLSERDPVQKLSRSIELWANGASDHFYDLDKSKAPAPLVELAELTLLMGHGFTGRTWTAADWTRMRELWEQACVAVDRQLGVESPDWGEW